MRAWMGALSAIVVFAGLTYGAISFHKEGDLPGCGERTYSESEIAAVRQLQRPANPDSVTSADILVEAPPAVIWDIVEHFESVWPASNPAHVQTCVLTPPETVHEDMIYHDIEQVGGITARMYAHVYDVIPERRFRWKANAQYDLGIVRLPIRQGGTFIIEPRDGETLISHEVWAEFPDSTTGNVAQWIARHILDMEANAVDHNRVELEWFQRKARERVGSASTGLTSPWADAS